MNNDGVMATGVASVSGDSMFANNQEDAETKQAQREQTAALLEILPNAEKELEQLDRELANLNVLTDFVVELDDIPTELGEADVRAKLHARFAYVNYLLNRRAVILAALEEGHVDVSMYAWQPPAFRIPERVVTAPRPYGWRAIAVGIADLFRRRPMK